ncbi:glycosyltransferase [Anaerosinus sp.]
MKSVTIIVPCYNEEAVLEKLYARLDTVLNSLDSYRFEVLFVNDGSSDNTLTVIKSLHQRDSRISYLDFSRNFGKEMAMVAGLDHADSDAVVLMDADLQHPPEMIRDMLIYWEQGYDDVYTKRKNRLDEGVIKRNITEAFYNILQKVSRIDIQKNVGDFRLLDRRCVNSLRLLRESQRYTKGMFSWVGYKKKEVLFQCEPRAAGQTKWNYFSLINLAIEGITSFTTLPLKIASLLGSFISIIAMLFMGWIILNTLLYGDPVQGYPTLMTTILFLGGIQLIFLGVIGEYLSRIFNESKNRPLYIINEYNGRKVTYRARTERDREYLDE